jgi:hypothetical protein
LLTNADFINLSAYFGALTPFVSAYILGKAYMPNGDDSTNSSTTTDAPINSGTTSGIVSTPDIPVVTKPDSEIG